jgi:tetratricopeptide (TPR) repeat protein
MGKASKQKKLRTRVEPPPAPQPMAAIPSVPALPVFLVTFGVALLGYWFTFARNVTLVDSGELILAAAELGVAHPPGTPLHSLLGHLFTLFPLGSIAARVAFMSAFFAAAAAGLAALLAREVTSEDPSPRAAAGAISTGLTLAFSVTLWFYASVAEVYTLHLALVGLILFLMLRWHSRMRVNPQSDTHLVTLAAFVFGLALGVHHVTAILLLLPALPIFVWRTAGWRFFTSRALAKAFLASLTGLAIYVYLPLAAKSHPIFNWGNPSNLQRFYWHISAKQYQVNLFSASREIVLQHLTTFFSWAFWQFTPLGFAAALFGLALLWRRERTIFWFTALIVLSNVLYTINYDIAEDTDAYYLITYLALTMPIGAAAAWLLARFRAGVPGAAVLTCLVLLPAGNYALHRFPSDHSHYPIARAYVEDALRPVQANGLLLTMDWQFYSPYLYKHHLEGFRPDATVVDVNLMRRSWYVRGYLDRQFPEMMRACKAERDAFLDNLERWEQGRAVDPNQINAHFVALINAFVRYHVTRDAAYTMLPMEEGVGTGYSWVPQGLVMRLVLDDAFRPETYPLQLEIFNGSTFLDEVARGKVRRFYAEMIANRGRYLSFHGRPAEALPQLESSVRLDPTFDRGYEFLGDLYASQGKTAEATEAYRNALRINSSNAAAARGLKGSPGVP